MSGFVRQSNDDELRLRQGNSFSYAFLAVGTAVNPLNFVIVNPNASGVIVILTRWLVSDSVANSCTLFLANGNPGLAASNAPFKNLVGSSLNGVVTTQQAIAATPANFGAFASVTLAAGVPAELIAPRSQIMMPANNFVFCSFGAVAGNDCVTIDWYELPT